MPLFSKLVTLALPLTATIVAANALVATPKQQLDSNLTNPGIDPITIDKLPPSDVEAIMESMSPVMLESIGFSSERAADIAKAIAEAEVISSEIFEKMGYSRDKAAAIAAVMSLRKIKREAQSDDSEEGALPLVAVAAHVDDAKDTPKPQHPSQYIGLSVADPGKVACCILVGPLCAAIC